MLLEKSFKFNSSMVLIFESIDGDTFEGRTGGAPICILGYRTEDCLSPYMDELTEENEKDN